MPAFDIENDGAVLSANREATTLEDEWEWSNTRQLMAVVAPRNQACKGHLCTGCEWAKRWSHTASVPISPGCTPNPCATSRTANRLMTRPRANASFEWLPRILMVARRIPLALTSSRIGRILKFGVERHESSPRAAPSPKRGLGDVRRP